MTSEQELERFFKDFSPEERKRVESFPEYQHAIKKGDFIAAAEVASVILLNNLSWGATQKILEQHFPEKR